MATPTKSTIIKAKAPNHQSIGTTLANTKNTKHQNMETASSNKKCSVNTRSPATKFRAYQHKNLRLNNVNSSTNNQHPSSWALASTRFTKPKTKYYEVISKPKNELSGAFSSSSDNKTNARRHTSYTPTRYNHDHEQRGREQITCKRRPYSCIFDRRRRIKGSNCLRDDDIDNLTTLDLPALEVHIPHGGVKSLDNNHHDRHSNNYDQGQKHSLDLRKSNYEEDQHSADFSNTSSTPKGKKLDWIQYIYDKHTHQNEKIDSQRNNTSDTGLNNRSEVYLISSSLTDSQSGHDDDDGFDFSDKKDEKQADKQELVDEFQKGDLQLFLESISSHSTEYENEQCYDVTAPSSTTINEQSDTARMLDCKNISSILDDYDDDHDEYNHDGNNKKENEGTYTSFFHKVQYCHQDLPEQKQRQRLMQKNDGCVAPPPLKNIPDIQQVELIAKVPRLVLSIHRLEKKVADLANELKEKDDKIDQLERELIAAYGNHRDTSLNVRNDDKEEEIRNELIKRELRLSDRQNCLTLNSDTDQLHEIAQNEIAQLSIKSSSYILDLKKKDDIKLLKELHQNEIMKLTEIHRREYLNLQGKTLNWIMSKSDLIQEQSRELAYVRHEISKLKENYDELKVTSNETFMEAQAAIAKNCETLSLYAQEELRETEQAAAELINELQNELDDTYAQIARLQRNQDEKKELDRPDEDAICGSMKTETCKLLSNAVPNYLTSWLDFSAKFRDAISGKMTIDEKKETDLDTVSVLNAESLIKELCFDSSVCSKSSFQSEDFLDAIEYEECV